MRKSTRLSNVYTETPLPYQPHLAEEDTKNWSNNESHSLRHDYIDCVCGTSWPSNGPEHAMGGNGVWAQVSTGPANSLGKGPQEPRQNGCGPQDSHNIRSQRLLTWGTVEPIHELLGRDGPEIGRTNYSALRKYQYLQHVDQQGKHGGVNQCHVDDRSLLQYNQWHGEVFQRQKHPIHLQNILPTGYHAIMESGKYVESCKE